MKITKDQAMAVVAAALQHAHEVGDCLFCDLSGTDVHAWHDPICPLRDIDPVFPPKKSPLKRSKE